MVDYRQKMGLHSVSVSVSVGSRNIALLILQNTLTTNRMELSMRKKMNPLSLLASILFVCLVFSSKLSSQQLDTGALPDLDPKTNITIRTGMETLKNLLNEEPTIRYYHSDGVAVRRGKKIYDANCISCHGPEGKSTVPVYPRLYRQQAMYIQGQLHAFKNGIRTSGNSAMMKPFADQLSIQDIEDVSYYLQYAGTGYEKMPKPPKGFILPDSGQLQDTTDVHGEDSDYRINPPSYKLISDNKITLDNNTKLMWQTNGYESLSMPKGEDYCSSLELGGYSDWRLPTIKELQTTASYRSTQPAADVRYFKGIPIGSSGYWAGPRIPENIDSGWHVGYPDGHVMGYSAHAGKYIRCVRADDGAMYLYNDFLDNGNGTVADRTTGLSWQKEAEPELRSWQDSIAYCENLQLAGQEDWRLPNMVELVSLVDYTAYNPSIDKEAFPNTRTDLYYWTSTSDVAPGARNLLTGLVGNPIRNENMEHTSKLENHVAWGLSFQEGGAWRYPKQHRNYARCVR